MENKYYCVIDSQNNYKEYVSVVNWIPLYYDMEDGDMLLDAPIPNFRSYAGDDGLVNPKWDGTAWIEGANSTECDEWERSHPKPFNEVPSEREKLRADLDYVMLMMGMDVDPD